MIDTETHLPTEGQLRRSERDMHDRFYRAPQIVQCFLERAAQELPVGAEVRQWSLNRAITLFTRDGPALVICYEYIEDDVIGCLDLVVETARGYCHDEMAA